MAKYIYLIPKSFFNKNTKLGTEKCKFGKLLGIKELSLEEVRIIKNDSSSKIFNIMEERDRAIELYYGSISRSHDIKIKVEGNIIKTNQPGFVIGKRGSALAEMQKRLGIRGRFQVKKLSLQGKEKIKHFESLRFRQNEVVALFLEALEDDDKVFLEYLAEERKERWNTQVGPGDAYYHQAEKGLSVLYSLMLLGYCSVSDYDKERHRNYYYFKIEYCLDIIKNTHKKYSEIKRLVEEYKKKGGE